MWFNKVWHWFNLTHGVMAAKQSNLYDFLTARPSSSPSSSHTTIENGKLISSVDVMKFINLL